MVIIVATESDASFVVSTDKIAYQGITKQKVVFVIYITEKKYTSFIEKKFVSQLNTDIILHLEFRPL